jgi:signal transduction histidine kinase
MLGRKLSRERQFWIRVVVCFLIGLTLLLWDAEPNYDLRLRLRGAQNTAQDIVLITIREREWTSLFSETRNVIRPLKEITALTDSFFWHENTWARILNAILELRPKAVGVCFYFGDNLQSVHLSDRNETLFANEKIVWAGDLDSNGRVLMPKFSNIYGNNVGVGELRADNDGLVRSFAPRLLQLPHFALRLAQRFENGTSTEPPAELSEHLLINYQGPSRTFTQYNLTDLFEKRIPIEQLEGKIVLIGAEDSQGHRFITPVGQMSRAEIFANMTDNLLHKKWINHTSFWFYLVYLFALLLISLWILSYYPQSVSLVFFVMISLLCLALSAWVFDSYYFWIPAEAPLVQLGATYILFLSYRLSLKEKETWRLEQEKRTISEIEQLKHNFVSLISHDLKTPIARIQAVVDRLLAQDQSNPPTHQNATFRLDLQSIRNSSNDLYRYIQSILQMTRVESRDFKIHSEVTDINEIIEQVLQQLGSAAREKSIRLEASLEPLFSIELDTTLIYEVILNLIENAIKYTPAGGEIRVTSQEINDRVFINVQDSGPGIASDEIDKVWEKFYRGHAHALSTKGSGLGLYLVKYFIELHGGQVFLQSELGRGTRIGFSLPLSTEDS